MLLKGHTLGWDAMRESWGDLSYAITALKLGYIPFWNHLERGGYPFLADPQTAVFYPLSWPIYLVGIIFGQGYWLAVVRALLHYLISFIGCQFLALRWGASRYLSLFFAIVYSFSGRLLKAKDNAGLWTMVWLPWLILYVDKALNKPSARTACLLALVMSCTFYAGYPPNLARSLVLIFCWAIFQVCQKLYGDQQANKKEYLFALLKWSLFSGILTVLLCSPGMMSTLSILEDSERTSLSMTQILSSRFHLSDLSELLFPRLINPMSYSLVYIGFLPITLVILALYSRIIDRKDKLFWGGMALVSLLWTCGKNFPFLKYFVLYIPTFSLWRIAEQYSFLLVFSLAILVLKIGIKIESHGLSLSTLNHEVEEDHDKSQSGSYSLPYIHWVNTFQYTLVTAFLVCCFEYFVWGTFSVSRWFVVTCLIIFFALILFRKMFGQSFTPKQFWITLSLLTLIDIGVQQQALVNISQPIPNTSRDRYLNVKKPFRRFADSSVLKWRAASRVNKPDLLGRYSTMVSKRWTKFKNKAANHKSLYAWGSVEQIFTRSKKPVQYIKDSVPYAFVTQNYKIFTSGDRLLNTMSKQNPKERLFAFLENDFLSSQFTITDHDHLPDAVQILRAEWGEVDLKIATETPGILVLNESYSRWWKFRIGQQTWQKTNRLNYLFQGVAIPAGNYRVQFRYDEELTKWAMKVAGITLLFIVIYLIRIRLKSDLAIV